MPVRTVIEHGTKDKRSVAFSLDWPGWSRGAKSADARPGDARVLSGALPAGRGIWPGWRDEFDAAGPLEIVEERVGTGSTDFWGISFSPSSTEHGPMGEAELERKITLLRACWAFFDGVAARVSPEMRKGPRGGGRDRNRIIRHTIRTESEDFAKQVGLRIPEEAALTPEGLQAAPEELRRGDARVQRRGGREAHAIVDPAVPHPTLRLPHARPCVGDGGQGPHRSEGAPTMKLPLRRQR